MTTKDLLDQALIRLGKLRDTEWATDISVAETPKEKAAGLTAKDELMFAIRVGLPWALDELERREKRDEELKMQLHLELLRLDHILGYIPGPPDQILIAQLDRLAEVLGWTRPTWWV